MGAYTGKLSESVKRRPIARTSRKTKPDIASKRGTWEKETPDATPLSGGRNKSDIVVEENDFPEEPGDNAISDTPNLTKRLWGGG